MERVLDWPPIFWTIRVVLLILFLGGGWVALLYLARFFRPRHILALLRSGLPAFRSVGGSLQLLGQKAEVNAALDAVRDDQLEAGLQRLADLEERVRGMADSVEYLLRKGGHVEAERQRLPEGGRGAGEGEERVGSDGAPPRPE
jgi:hypothetical protein